jgi:hypothetical protein
LIDSFFLAEIEYEAPNNNLGRFEGNLTWKGKTLPLKNDNVLLRGTRLRNTHWAFGSKKFERKKNFYIIFFFNQNFQLFVMLARIRN